MVKKLGGELRKTFRYTISHNISFMRQDSKLSLGRPWDFEEEDSGDTSASLTASRLPFGLKGVGRQECPTIMRLRSATNGERSITEYYVRMSKIISLFSD